MIHNTHYKVKILMVGPIASGKTTLANFLSEAVELNSSGSTGSGEYRPTKGCRIVEFEVPNVQVAGTSTYATAEVELWDVSGDRQYETTWPVMQRGAQGVIFVYNPSGGEDHSNYLSSMYTQFVQQNGLKENQCVVFCHNKPGGGEVTSSLGGPFSKISQLDTQLDDDSGRVRQDFTSFLSTILSQVVEATNNTENYVMS